MQLDMILPKVGQTNLMNTLVLLILKVDGQERVSNAALQCAERRRFCCYLVPGTANYS